MCPPEALGVACAGHQAAAGSAEHRGAADAEPGLLPPPPAAVHQVRGAGPRVRQGGEDTIHDLPNRFPLRFPRGFLNKLHFGQAVLLKWHCCYRLAPRTKFLVSSALASPSVCSIPPFIRSSWRRMHPNPVATPSSPLSSLFCHASRRPISPYHLLLRSHDLGVSLTISPGATWRVEPT